MNNEQLLNELEQVRLRYRQLILRRATAAGALLVALAGVATLAALRGAISMENLGLILFLLAVAGAASVPFVVARLRKLNDPLLIAHRVEKQYPDLDTRLLAALEQKPEEGGLGYLQQSVINQAVQHARRHGWEEIVPSKKLRIAGIANVTMVVLVAGVTAALLMHVVNRPKVRVPEQPRIAAEEPFEIKVEPGNTELERGTALLVLARFGTPRLPANVELLYKDAEGKLKQMKMSESSLDDPLFALRIPSVKTDLEYAVRYDDNETRWFTAKVFDYPELRQADADLKFPEYTGQGEKRVEDTRSITAVEGTKATITFRLNKPVAEARLQPVRRAAPRADATNPLNRGGAAPAPPPHC